MQLIECLLVNDTVCAADSLLVSGTGSVQLIECLSVNALGLCSDSLSVSGTGSVQLIELPIFMMSPIRFEPEASSSGGRFYIKLWYGVLCSTCTGAGSLRL